MRIAIIGCSHGRHAQLKVPEADMLIHTGDYSRRGDQSDAISFLKWLEAQPHKHKVFVDGNHDHFSQLHPKVFAELVAEEAPSCHHLCDSGVILDGYHLYGSPWSPTFGRWYWNADRGDTIQAHWDKIPLDTQTLITHGPAMGHLDLIMPTLDGERDLHQGCANLRTTIDERLHMLQLHAFSHLHYEGCQTKVANGVTYVNGAVVDDGYSIRGQIQVVDIQP